MTLLVASPFFASSPCHSLWCQPQPQQYKCSKLTRDEIASLSDTDRNAIPFFAAVLLAATSFATIVSTSLGLQPRVPSMCETRVGSVGTGLCTAALIRLLASLKGDAICPLNSNVIRPSFTSNITANEASSASASSTIETENCLPQWFLQFLPLVCHFVFLLFLSMTPPSKQTLTAFSCPFLMC